MIEELKKTEKGKTVLVNADVLAELIQRLERVESAADLARLSNYDNKRFQRGPNKFKLTVYIDPETKQEKIVTGWRTIKDISKKDPVVGLIEQQEYEILFEDNTKLVIKGYLNFSDFRYGKQIIAEEVSRVVDENGIILKLKLPDGRVLDIDAKFVN